MAKVPHLVTFRCDNNFDVVAVRFSKQTCTRGVGGGLAPVVQIFGILLFPSRDVGI